MSLKKLNVDLDAIVEAMESGDGFMDEMTWYLDKETGKVEMAKDPESSWDDDDDDDEDDSDDDLTELDRAIANDTEGRYQFIPTTHSHDAWQVMADFVETVPDPRFRQRLQRAIEGKGAFRRFKDELEEDFETRKKWFAFEAEAKREWARDWLAEIGIESTWSPPVVKQKLSDWQPKIVCIHHVQITIPVGQEGAAREFYCKVMGLQEIDKPKSLAVRGGLWLEVGDLQVHVGVEDGENRTATKAHLAYQVTDIAKWRDRIAKAGLAISDSVPIDGFERFEFRDPFGNRVELIQPVE